jgi:hypothetical protein
VLQEILTLCVKFKTALEIRFSLAAVSVHISVLRIEICQAIHTFSFFVCLPKVIYNVTQKSYTHDTYFICDKVQFNSCSKYYIYLFAYDF